MKYNITTYGCQMNIHESEKLAGILEYLGYEQTDSKQEADVLVFNTCAIRENAQNRVFGNVGALKQMKKDFPHKIVAVCGCMTQQKEVAQSLYKTFPFVDIIFGTHNLIKFEEFMKKYQKKHKRIIEVQEKEELVEYSKMVRTSGKNAWVNIMYGCDNFCTYCIVPYVRGRERSRKKEDILNEVKELVKSGKYETITLLGQNVNSYGKKSREENGNFAQLIKSVCQIEGDFKVTFMTSNPNDFTDELIETISTQDKVLKEIHLPVQSGNSRILKMMNRKYTREEYLTLVQKIKKAIPNVKLTSDFIVGFPTETKEEFEDTCSLVRQVGFNSIFAFMYSKRPGTPAEVFEDQISDEEKHYRVNHLLNLQKEIQKRRLGENK